ncbi:lysine transporter LysE [Thioclava sp. SK-1]|uniref:LysE family translocator n=1 Tax=Thioclava sp. SK-1 TaxID=1889770 RepID=UPI00082439A5|nr:LysE family translocator [Thioclava sp. SK-1]OCX63412.1 lysine transporter LysE [Thioclava sp. SK-1]
MTLTLSQLALYTGALFVLFLTPGPVWLALLARTLTGGMAAAWPLAVGVALGDVFWSVSAILGVSVLLELYGGLLDLLRWVAVIMFLVMGGLLIRHADTKIDQNNRLTRPGIWAGFIAGIVVIIGNPKAILFYMGLLPTFFNLDQMTAVDIGVIGAISAIVPLIGNLMIGACVEQMRRFFAQQHAVARLNRIAGGLMIAVALLIAVT